MSNCGKTDHCCWFQGKECDYLTASTHPDFMYACSLKVKYGSWEAVHSSEEYVRDVQDKQRAASPGGIDCGDWPTGRICNTCGEKG